jgi:hypothetical protein
VANERRVRVMNLFGSLGAGMLVADTSIAFGAVPAALPAIDSTKHAALVLEPDTPAEEVVYVTAYTAGASSATVLRGQEGTTAVGHPVGALWVHGPTRRDSAAGRVAYAVRTSGNLTLGSTTWAAIDPGLDLAVQAYPGDVVEASFSGFSGNEAADFFGDYCTLVAGVLTTSFATGAAVVAGSGGAACLRAVAGGYFPLGNSLMLRVGAGDLSGGLVTVRFVYRVASGSRTVFASSASTNVPASTRLVNHGPQEA